MGYDEKAIDYYAIYISILSLLDLQGCCYYLNL